MQASQQATMAAQQATQQAQQDAQAANQRAMQDAQAASSSNCCTLPQAATPQFSFKAGAYASPLRVRISSRTHGAVIYYTTDGWTPTTASQRYTGPITISSTTTLQAIAVAPNCSESLIASAVYEFPNVSQPQPSAAMLPALPAKDGSMVLRLDAKIPLRITSPVDSKTAQVGDAVSFALAEDLKAGEVVLAPKGTPAVGRVVQVDRAGLAGLPGEIVFQVTSLTLHGQAIPLRGSEALQGKTEINKARSIFFVPVVGFAGLLVRGQDAQIPAGMPLTATMPAGTVLPVPAG